MRGFGQHPHGVGRRNLLPVITHRSSTLGAISPSPMTKPIFYSICLARAWRFLRFLWLALAASPAHANDTATAGGTPLSPIALAATPDGATIFIACATADRVITFDRTAGTVVRTSTMPAAPSGLALSADGARLYVTC